MPETRRLAPTVPTNLIGIPIVKPIVEPEALSVLTSTSNVNILEPATVDITLRSNVLYSVTLSLSTVTIGNTTPPLLAKIVFMFG